jgi:hypothetical protein
MKFYFDIEFLKGLQKADELNELIFDDFKYFISYSLKNDDCVIIGQENLDVVKLSEILFFRLLNQNSKSLDFISKNDFLINLENSKDTCFKFVFMNETVSVDAVRDDYGFYACSSKELNETWFKFHSRRSNEDLKRYIQAKESNFSFRSWEDLKEFTLPLNTFVIADRYLFESSESFQFNFFELLKNIGLKPLKKRRVNIVVITSEKIFEVEKEKNNDSKIKLFIKNYFPEKSTESYDLNESEVPDILFEIAFYEAKKTILKLLDESDFNFTLLKLDKHSYPKSTKAHWRAFITNTTFINCGHSFTIFGKNGKIRKEDYIHFSSLFWDGPKQNASDGIIKITKQAIENITNSEKYYDRKSSLFITPKRRFVFNDEIKTINFDLDTLS